jgi:hypothetical protein
MKPIIAIFRPVLMLLPGPLRIGTLLLYMAIEAHPKGSTTKRLYTNQFAGVNAESRIVV